MTTVEEETVKCAVCGTESQIMSIGSTNEFGSPDLDLRPAEMFRSTIDMWIQRCRGCGLCAPDLTELETSASEAKEIVGQSVYQHQLNNSEFPELANSFLCSSLIEEETKNYDFAARLCLFAAWSCDDAENKAASILCRQKALQMLDAGRLAGQEFEEEPATEKGIEIDLLRRSGQFDRAMAVCEEALRQYSENGVHEIFAFQKSLIQRKDDGCYTLDDVDNI